MWVSRQLSGRFHSWPLGQSLDHLEGVRRFLPSTADIAPELRSYDVYLFNYKTEWLCRPPLSVAIGELERFLEEQNDRFATVKAAWLASYISSSSSKTENRAGK